MGICDNALIQLLIYKGKVDRIETIANLLYGDQT